MRLTVLDTDGSVMGQPLFAERLRAGAARVIDARDLGPRLAYSADHAAAFELSLRLGDFDTSAPEVIFFGGTTFHHLTANLLARHAEPLSVIHFDGAPDWTSWPRDTYCSWVPSALALPNVAHVITLGCAPGSLNNPELRLADLDAIDRERLEVFPWRHAATRVFRHHRDTPCWTYNSRHLHWRELADVDWLAFLDELIERLPTEAVYLTLDKTVLAHMPLNDVLTAIERLAPRRRIVGIDVCGEGVRTEPTGLIRRALGAATNEPSTAARREDNTVNARLLEAIAAAL